ncbi:MAG: hypothetical protein GXZ18_00555 [Synergistaceae bacterium]|nr:hypothetical protein [Synergistaceae bacterium]
MRKSFLFKSIVAIALTLLFAASALAISGPYSVHSSVISGTGAVQAVLTSQEFTVPAGSTAVITRYQHYNPSSGYINKKLGKQVYSITEKKDMADKKGVGLLELPAGEYRFIIGGTVGCTGLLEYKLYP